MIRQPHEAARRRTQAIILAAAVMGLLLSASFCMAAEITHETIPVGEKAPAFTAHTIEGGVFDLGEELSSKSVLLFFWSFFCGPCREEMPVIQDIYAAAKADGKAVEMVAVNLDETALHTPIKSFLKSAGYSYPIVVNKFGDEDSQLDKLYKVTGTPTMYMIRPDGTISYTHVGRIEPPDLKKAIEEHLLQPGT